MYSLIKPKPLYFCLSHSFKKGWTGLGLFRKKEKKIPISEVPPPPNEELKSASPENSAPSSKLDVSQSLKEKPSEPPAIISKTSAVETNKLSEEPPEPMGANTLLSKSHKSKDLMHKATTIPLPQGVDAPPIPLTRAGKDLPQDIPKPPVPIQKSEDHTIDIDVKEAVGTKKEDIEAIDDFSILDAEEKKEHEEQARQDQKKEDLLPPLEEIKTPEGTTPVEEKTPPVEEKKVPEEKKEPETPAVGEAEKIKEEMDDIAEHIGREQKDPVRSFYSEYKKMKKNEMLFKGPLFINVENYAKVKQTMDDGLKQLRKISHVGVKLTDESHRFEEQSAMLRDQLEKLQDILINVDRKLFAGDIT